MLSDLGVKFGFKGGSKARSEMEATGREWNKFHRTVDTGVSGINQSMGRLAAGMALKVGAVIGAVKLAGVAKDMLSAKNRIEITNEQSRLRALGLGDKDIELSEQAAGKFARKVGGVTAAAYTHAFYDTVSAYSSSSLAEQLKVNAIALLTGKATDMSAAEATALFGGFWGAASKVAKGKGAGKIRRGMGSGNRRHCGQVQNEGSGIGGRGQAFLEHPVSSGMVPATDGHVVGHADKFGPVRGNGRRGHETVRGQRPRGFRQNHGRGLP